MNQKTPFLQKSDEVKQASEVPNTSFSRTGLGIKYPEMTRSFGIKHKVRAKYFLYILDVIKLMV